MTLPALDKLSRLKRRLSVAFEFAPPDVETLTQSIYNQRAQAWRDALTECASKVGSRARGVGPFGVDRQVLMDMSRDDAISIRETFNRDLEREIERLYTANPEGDRAYYIERLTVWADKRAEYKDRQIALMNNKTARHYAQQRFIDMNKVSTRYRFVGPAPVCPDCGHHMAAGVVGQKYVDKHPAPVHPNCPHSWTMVGAKPGVDKDKLWVGGEPGVMAA